MLQVGEKQKCFSFAEFRLETESQKLIRHATEIHLAKRPFYVLLYLIENRARIVSREELLNKFWDGRDVYDDALRKAVGAIRKALEDTEKPFRLIETRWGGGYRFIGKIEEIAAINAENAHSPATDLALLLDNSALSADLAMAAETSASAENSKTAGRNSRYILLSMGGTSLLLLAVLGFFWSPPTRLPEKSLPPESMVAESPVSRSIAVMPIKNLTGNPANDYLSDGVTESLINQLSQIKELKVTSRGSAFQFKNQETDAREIGQKLGVETILESSLKQNGELVRLEARLVSTKDGRILWADDFHEKKLADVFALQDGITCQVVTKLKVKLCGEVSPAARYTQNVKAYQLYLQGLYYRNRLDTDNAIDFFNQALQIDPNYALAHEGLATVYAVMELNSVVPPGTAAPLAELHAQKALELDDSLAGAYLALGVVKTLNNYDLAERERYYRQALLKNPNHRTAHLWLSGIYTARGEFEQAEAEALRAQEIDPLSYGVRLTLADIYFYWRKPDKVIEQAELMLALKPDDEQAFSWLALSHAQKGDFEKAFAELKKLPPDHATRITVLVAAGRTAEARKLVEAFANSAAAKNRPYEVAETYALIGDKETAFAWLEKSYQMRQANLVSIKVDPTLDNLRDDARYADLLRRVGLGAN